MVRRRRSARSAPRSARVPGADETEPVVRPGLVRWLWYAVGGRLPPRHRRWVLYDATCRTWPLRHFGRTAIQLIVIAVPVLSLVPGAWWVRLVALLLGCLVALQYSLFIMEGSVEHRVRKAGYPPGTVERCRAAATAEQRRAAAARYAARYRR